MKTSERERKRIGTPPSRAKRIFCSSTPRKRRDTFDLSMLQSWRWRSMIFSRVGDLHQSSSPAHLLRRTTGSSTWRGCRHHGPVAPLVQDCKVERLQSLVLLPNLVASQCHAAQRPRPPFSLPAVHLHRWWRSPTGRRTPGRRMPPRVRRPTPAWRVPAPGVVIATPHATPPI